MNATNSTAAAANTGSLIGGLTLLLIVFILYFLPALVAAHRKHRQTVPILLLNFFLGWSVLGWIFAIVWAFTNSTPQTIVVQAPRQGPSSRGAHTRLTRRPSAPAGALS